MGTARSRIPLAASEGRLSFGMIPKRKEVKVSNSVTFFLSNKSLIHFSLTSLQTNNHALSPLSRKQYFDIRGAGTAATHCRNRILMMPVTGGLFPMTCQAARARSKCSPGWPGV